ncbi:MAG: hypothetical protein KDK27_16885 [Leptospiraceae bacterium]|nr:hypothetical protein [Leptospiraceae bacterium]
MAQNGPRGESSVDQEMARIYSHPRQDLRGDDTVNYWTRYGQVELKLEKSFFRPGEDIPVLFRIRNTGYRVIRIYPTEKPWGSYQFMVLDRAGNEIPMQFDERAYNRRENGERTVVNNLGEQVKEIILHPGETFEKILYLNDFYRLAAGSEFRVVGYFYPDRRFEYFVRSTNTAHLNLDVVRTDPNRVRAEAETQAATRQPTHVTPEETVYLFLSAEMRSNWSNYLKYLELEKFITSYDRFAAPYAQALPQERPGILQEFARFLTARPADHLRRFEILNSEPERTPDGEMIPDGRYFVYVRAVREGGGYTVQYEYKYALERGRNENAGFWKIINVEAQIRR